MDRETGEVHHGHNDRRPATNDTKTRVGAKHDGKPPDKLHPDLKPRVEHLNDNPRELNKDGKPKSNPGSHAEVQSTNGALRDREEQNKTRPADDKLPEGKEALPDLTTVQQPRDLDPDRTPPADPTKTKDDMACCPNCSYITHGSDQASGTNHLTGEDGNPSVPKADGTPSSPVPKPPAPNPPAPE